MHVEMNLNIVSVSAQIVAWAVIAILLARMYKRKPVKLKVWKIIVVFFVGLFSFSIKWTIHDTLINLSILPLGVWILLLFKGRHERWPYYRSFAWFGFFANYLLLAASLVSVPLNDAIYPEDQLSTYLSNVENASVIKTHPSAGDQSLSKKDLVEQIPNMKKKGLLSEEWYQEAFVNVDSKKRTERFPYMLAGTTPRFGSGLHMLVYLERDGKGLLIKTPKKQIYYRSSVSLLKGANP